MQTENSSAVTVPVLEFSHGGIMRTLVKHPSYVRALKDGQITLADFKAKPWTLRAELNGAERKFKLSPSDKDAIRGAKDILNGHQSSPAAFADWLAERDSRRGVTIGQLARDWRELKYPDHNGRPRTPEAIVNLEAFFDSALEWWSGIRVSVAETKFADFIAWRRANSKRGTGERAADLELNTLSCLCAWAVFARKIEANPFRGRKQGGSRPVFRDKSDVLHCHEAMPSSDEELHRVLTWFWTGSEDKRRIIAGAWLAWCALTGLRPGEPAFLQRHKPLETVPANPKQLAPGTIFPIRTAAGVAAVRKMKVERLKRGQNPYVAMHTAAVDFLAAWETWLAANIPASIYLFPDPDELSIPLRDDGDKVLNGFLHRACVHCQITPCKPHGFGRAYYVRVRRSQGLDDSTIACELGQTTNGKLIRDTYGDPDDMVGGALFDWLPEDEKQKPMPAAWALLRNPAQPSNIVVLP